MFIEKSEEEWYHWIFRYETKNNITKNKSQKVAEEEKNLFRSQKPTFPNRIKKTMESGRSC